ncbi:MAG: TrbG/VirB9 family P-type conjugative transfer protein [Deltaproteobacteria bacterium]|nr:TrbG/VirB9 family P-type conjugative transfer protein [Deltaproteobacteria bacterium]
MRYSILAAAIILAGCASQPPPPIVKVEPPPKKIVIPPDPFADLSPDVVTAIKNNQTPTLHDGITVLFPYSSNQAWTVYCQPLRATEIRLSPDEWTDKDSVILGDSVRWAIKVSGQAVMVEPLGTSADPNMTSNLIIHTNKRSYHLMLKLRSRFMAAVQWYYPVEVREQQAARQQAQREATAQAAEAPAPQPQQQEVADQ